MKIYLRLLLLIVVLPLAAQEPFELREGDRVVFVGNTFFERDVQHGYLETFLTARWTDRNIKFRNVGWSGDNVWGHSRGSKFDPLNGNKPPGGFGNPEDGFKKLIKHVTDQKPTVIFVAYGMSESFEGENGLPAFEKQLERLLDRLAETGARIVLVSPIRHEKLPPPFPDPTEHNKNLALYTESIRKAAATRGFGFVNLYEQLAAAKSPQPLTDNGIHLNVNGYLTVALAIERALGLKPTNWSSAAARLEPLRRVINKKNEYFFHQWRPANDTYIFGFRRNEQGRNEIDIPQFDPLIAAKEAEIAKLRKGEPVPVPPAAPATPTTLSEKSDPDPELERATFKVAEGFEVNLFAAEPMAVKPVAINFDAQGRLWIAATAMYPQIKPGEDPNDRILILEDSDGDGRADKSSVFADGLMMPTGVVPGDGGAYVANSTELVFLKDTNSDGRADSRRVVLSGFGTEDTHHILHTLRWGNDGSLHFSQSVYIHSHIETPTGTLRHKSGAIWRYRTASADLSILVRGLCNTWGHSLDYWGQSFATDGCQDGGVHYVLPGAMLPNFMAAERQLPGLNPGSPKYCGAEIISGRHFPDDWQGNVITHDFRANRTVRFAITENSAGYKSKLMPDLIKSSDINFRPVDIKIGPDGALYIADWYNPIINHGEVDFRDPRRDKSHGRIWRVTAKGRPLAPRPKLVGATIPELLNHLKSPEDWTRHFAKRVLSDRGTKEVLPALAAWVKSLDPKDANYEHHRLEALWVYETLDVVEPNLLDQLLRSTEPHVRTAAVRTLSHWKSRIPNTVELLALLVTDEFPRVRVEAVRALAAIPQPRSIELAMRALDKPVDKFLDYALWLTANNLKSIWVPALERGELSFGGNDQQLQFALQSVGSPKAVETMLAQLRAGKIAADRQENIFQFVASFGTSSDITALFDWALEKRDGRAFAALDRAARQRKIQPSGDLSRLKPLLSTSDEAIRLAGACKVEALRADITTLAETKQTRAAFDALADLGGAESIAALQKISANSTAATAALASLDPKAAASRAAAFVAAGKSAELMSAFLQHQGGAEALAVALGTQKISSDAAKLALRAMYAAGRSDDALEKVLKPAAGLTADRKALTSDELKQLIAEVQKKGNATRGEQVFRREDVSCLKCHAVATKGGKLAPDLATIGSAAPLDYIIESVLDPEKATKDGYGTTIVTTKDEDLITGIEVRRTSKELVLRDATRDEIVIPLDDIKEERPGRSMMPGGLADLLTRQELLDLVRYLSELGRTR